jgi:phospholipid transport system substrate-binding protein
MTRSATRRGLLAIAFMSSLVAGQNTVFAQMGGPAGPIRALNEALLRIMHAGQATPFAQRAAMLTPAVQAAFDLQQILQTSVGLRWSAFNAQQQNELLDVFARYTVASYVANFDSFNGETFGVLPELRQVGKDQVVQTRIIPASGDPTRIDYVMRPTDTGWKAVDVLLDGSISRVAVQRSDFRSLLSNGDPGRLIASLRAKTQKLESGARP